MLYRYPDPVRVVRGGMVEDTSWLLPKVHFWIRSAQPWVRLPPGSVSYDTQPASRPAGTILIA